MKKFTAFILIPIILIITGCNGNQAQPSGSNELTIATFFESRFLEFAARKFEELNEGVTVTINVYANEEFDIARYSQIINTSLMSGRGEDIIDVSFLNWVNLANRGRLLDLNGKIEFLPGEYYQTVLDAYIFHGGRYAIPLCFYLNALSFNEGFSHYENLESITLHDLIKLAGENPENQLISSGGGMSAPMLAMQMFDLNFNEFIDIRNKTANVDNEKFISLLENINSIADNLNFRYSWETALIIEHFLYNPVNSVNGLVDYTGMFLLKGDNGGSLITPFGFLPAVNANGENQGLAVKFMQFLISYETQSSPELMFNPINRKASASMAALLLGEIRAGGYAAEGFDLLQNIALFNGLADRLTIVKNSDHFINDFIRTEIMRYFDGEVSAQQAARNLQSRLNTYLNE